MDAVKEKRYYGWYMVMVSAIIYALVYSTTSTGSVFTISITQEQGFSRSLWSSKSIFTCIGSLISCYMSGRLIQRFGLKRIMLISTAGVASTFFIPLMFTDIRQYYVLSVYSSATWCAATIMSVPILINRWFGPKKKGIAISLTLAGSGVGSILMSPLLRYLCENYGWRKTYIFEGVMLLVVMLPLIYFTVVERPQEKGYTERLGEKESTGSGASAGKTVLTGVPYKEGIKSIVFFTVVMGIMLIQICNASVTNHRTPYLTDLFNGNAVKAASISGIAIGSLTIGKIVLGSLCDKIGVKKGLLLGMTSYFCCLLMLFLSIYSTNFIYLYLMFFCIGGSVGTIVTPLIVSTVFGDKDYGRYLGTIQSITAFGTPIGNMFSAYVFDKTGGYSGAWMVVSRAALIAIPMIFISIVIANRRRAKLPVSMKEATV